MNIKIMNYSIFRSYSTYCIHKTWASSMWKYSYPHNRPWRPIGLSDVETVGSQMVVKLSALHAGRALLPRNLFFYFCTWSNQNIFSATVYKYKCIQILDIINSIYPSFSSLVAIFKQSFKSSINTILSWFFYYCRFQLELSFPTFCYVCL
jgi:hypothetical protein